LLFCAASVLFISLHAVALQTDLTAEHENAAGQEFVEQHRFDEAKRAFHRAMRLKPLYPDALENLALLELMTSSEDQAGILANQLLQVAPDNFNGHLIEGIVLLSHGNPSRALPHFTTLYSAAGDDPLVLAGMIECASELGQDIEARGLSRQALTHND
jgi:Flp pilus assembly protein TadD